MRILLINPWIIDFKAYDEWMRPLPLYRLLETLSGSHDVGLIDCLAAVKREKRYSTADFESVVIEKPEIFASIPRRFKRYGMGVEAFRAKLRDFGRPDVAGVTSLMTFWQPAYRLAVEEIRAIWGDVPVVLGGLYASLMPAHAASVPGVRLYNGRNFPAPAGSGRTFLTAAAMRGVLPLRLQEGCPFHCDYCASGYIHGRSVRQAPLEDNLARLEMFAASGGRDVVFYDDALLYRFEDSFGPFLARVIERGYPVRMHLPNGIHARYVTARVAELMFEAGVRTVRLGYERPGAAEKVTGAELARAVGDLRAAGFDGRAIGVYLLAGIEPGLAGIREAADFIHSLGARVFFNRYSPVPGSALFARKAAEFPELPAKPLLHNDATYLFTHGGFDWEEVRQLTEYIKGLNREQAAFTPPAQESRSNLG